MKKKCRKWLCLICWMVVIYLFSAQPHSGEVTHGVLLKILPSFHGSVFVDWLNFLVRKSAHFWEYFILTYFIYSLLEEYFEGKKFIILFSLLFCFFYSLTDEVHQVFVPGRSGMFRDCIVDTCGGGFFILLHLLLCRKKKVVKYPLRHKIRQKIID